MIETFIKDVDNGLSKSHKTLPSKYFYDAIGDKIFVKIMRMPEYYLTRAEHNIFKNQTNKIIESLQIKPNSFFELIELGAGDGTKTKLLLKELLHQNFNFSYIPIDISKDALTDLENSLKTEIPELNVNTKQGDYFEILESLKNDDTQKVVLFLGSNIGNMTDNEAKQFLKNLNSSLHKKDAIFLGVDIIKSKEIVLPAYSDSAGITKNFNLNLLDRINKELGGNFNRNSFEHVATYSVGEGIARSYLVSKIAQDVTIDKLQKTYTFFEGEKIHTETSRKYNDAILNDILKNTDLKISTKLMDANNHFADYVLVKK